MSRQASSAIASLILTAIGVIVLVGRASADPSSHELGRWPGFQGPIAADLKADDLPLDWSPDKNIAWKASVPGYGQSSPVVWGSSVYVTSISGPMKETCHISAINLESGKIEWQREFASASKVENSNYVSKAAPTPVVDHQGVVVLFEVGNLVAISHEGETRWSKDLVEEHGELPSRHGLGSSLAQTGDLVFAWIERQTDPYLVAVEKSTGKTVWKVPGLAATSWSTPVLLSVGESQQLILSGGGKLAGYDVQSGKQLWSFDGISGNTVPTPQPCGNGQLLIGATVGRGEDSSGNAPASNCMLNVTKGEADNFDVDFKWRSKRATCSFGSPIVHEGLAYFVNSTGVLFCLDAETGDEVFAERIGDSIWATPLAVGNRIYLAGRSGTTTVIEAGKEFRKLAENRLWEAASQEDRSNAKSTNGANQPTTEPQQKQPIQYAIVGLRGRILIRSGDGVYCLSESLAR